MQVYEYQFLRKSNSSLENGFHYADYDKISYVKKRIHVNLRIFESGICMALLLPEPVLGMDLCLLSTSRFFILLEIKASSRSSASGMGLVNTSAFTIFTSANGFSFLSEPTCES